MKMIKTKRVQHRTKRVFLKLGTCSRTFFYILNREFDNSLEKEEQAIDLLAGGIMQQGYQCGMIWGASMAIGAEAFRRTTDLDQAIILTIRATQHIMKSFKVCAKSIECEDITNCDWSNKWSIAKYFFSGRFWSCYKLAEKWAPEAIEAAIEGLTLDVSGGKQCISCASEVAKKMGASNEELVMVAGFAGGLGLSGNGCGALAATIWMNSLLRVKTDTMKSSMSDPIAEQILNAFYKETDYEMCCDKISGQCFNSVDDHSTFIENGGCKKLIDVLAESGRLKKVDN